MNRREAFCLNLFEKCYDDNGFSIRKEYLNYLRGLITLIMARAYHTESNLKLDIQQIAEKIFSIITCREFNYQSKKKILCHRTKNINIITKYLKDDHPIEFYFAVGGGYKAATNIKSDIIELNYSLGLGEILVIYQISKLEKKIINIYPPGITFNIVLDNGVANYVNEIPISKTKAYADLYRKLISRFKKESIIRVIVQTEMFDWQKESMKIESEPVDYITAQEHANIVRFIGRKCTYDEAMWLKSKYLAAMSLSEKLFTNIIDNSIWFLQYSYGSSLTFRPFPGGASRIQAGDIALTIENEKVKPLLLSIRNSSEYNVNKVISDIDQFFLSIYE